MKEANVAKKEAAYDIDEQSKIENSSAPIGPGNPSKIEQQSIGKIINWFKMIFRKKKAQRGGENVYNLDSEIDTLNWSDSDSD